MESAAPVYPDIERIEALGVRCIAGDFAGPEAVVRHAPGRVTGALLALGLLTALPAPQVVADLSCCKIIKIDQPTGTVTLRDNTTGKVEKVSVKDPKQLSKLSVGQPADRSIGAPVK